MSLHEIKRVSLLDVPAKLREMAAEYERRSGELRTAIVVVGYADGFVCVRGFGERTSALEATGWLHRGLDVMTAGSGVDEDFSSSKPPAA
jgi:hypothetical protein